MTDPHEKARDRDRNAALRLVRDAARAGQLNALDAEHRVQQIEQAQTIGEIETHTRGLSAEAPSAGHAWPARPAGPMGGPGAFTPPPVPPGTPMAAPGTFAPPPARRGPSAAVVLLIVFVGFCLLSVVIPMVLSLVSFFAISVDDSEPPTFEETGQTEP